MNLHNLLNQSIQYQSNLQHAVGIYKQVARLYITVKNVGGM